MCQECVGDRALLTRRSFVASSLAAGTIASIAPGFGAATKSPAVAPIDVGGLVINPRPAWAVANPTAAMAAEEVRFLLVHHTAGPTPAPEQVVDELRGVYNFHTGPTKGWPDVAYNFFVDPYGGVWEGRQGSLDGPVEASATGGNQGFAQLVCLLGDFTSQMPTAAALDALERTLVWLAGRYGIDLGLESTTSFVSRGSNKWPVGTEVVANTVSGHRDMSQTACPGDTFYPYLTSTMRQNLARRVATSTTSTPDATEAATTTPPSTTAATVAPTTASVPSATSSSPTSALVEMTSPAAPSPIPTSSAPAAGDGQPGDDDSSVWWPNLGVGAIFLGAIGGGIWLHRRRTANAEDADKPPSSDPPGPRNGAGR